MKEIKFRAWHSIYKYMINEADIAVGWGVVLLEEPGVLSNEWMKISSLIPMQFTGLEDNTGKEIYEGDIICGTAPQWEKEVGVVVFERGGFGWGPHNHFAQYNDIYLGQMKIIGNIHENPDLIPKPHANCQPSDPHKF